LLCAGEKLNFEVTRGRRRPPLARFARLRNCG
jgi:hypothetical protein